MDSLGGAGMSAYANSDPKTQVMRQIQQEAAMQNARMLVEVIESIVPFSIFILDPCTSIAISGVGEIPLKLTKIWNRN